MSSRVVVSSGVRLAEIPQHIHFQIAITQVSGHRQRPLEAVGCSRTVADAAQRAAEADQGHGLPDPVAELLLQDQRLLTMIDRKSTRLNSSHVKISYAVFCLKK